MKINHILRPKNYDDVLLDIMNLRNAGLNVVSRETEQQCIKYFNRGLPIELLPLSLAINSVIRKKFPEYYKSIGFAQIKRTEIRYFDSSIKGVVLSMMPVRRIPKLENKPLVIP